ncbi:hypothetical protein [Sinorhizobium psoraleae]|uniref:hypothetical protein n=1 Tax=Sinorhizobium psoraleae TaxID=520838 RepID=UPI0022AFDCBF|nr:hypothetical protein [Sinorhizobium psoraleae]
MRISPPPTKGCEILLALIAGDVGEVDAEVGDVVFRGKHVRQRIDPSRRRIFGGVGLIDIENLIGTGAGGGIEARLGPTLVLAQ